LVGLGGLHVTAVEVDRAIEPMNDMTKSSWRG